MRLLDDPTVVVRNLTKVYRIDKDGSELGLTPNSRRTEVRALENVNLWATAGESIGVLGRNGSGKSTLLNILAGDSKMTSGEVWVSAQPTLLSVSAVLQPDLSGIQNVRLGLLARGLSLSEVKKLERSVGDWADIGDAIDRPLKTYSSGMRARLKFAMATAIRSEILLVDEALATGDAAFSERAGRRMDEFLEANGTVFIVSHSAASILRHCNRAIWLHEGRIIADGPVKEVAGLYQFWARTESAGDHTKARHLLNRARNSYHAPKIIFEHEAATMLDR